MTLSSCYGSGRSDNKGIKGGSFHAGGAAYSSSCAAAVNPQYFLASRDLTDEEMEEAENLPGGGYSDGKWTGENPPENEDDNGDPTYAAQHVWEDDNGTIIIIEDDGEITEITT